MNRITATRTAARAAVVAGLLAAVGSGLLGATNALAAPGDPVAPIDPGLITKLPPVLPPITVVPTVPPIRTIPPVYTIPPVKTLTAIPPTSSTSTTPPSSTTTAPPSTTTNPSHPSSTTQTTPSTTPPGQPHRYPKGAPETGGGSDSFPTAALGALGVLVVGFGGLAGTVVVRRRRAAESGR